MARPSPAVRRLASILDFLAARPDEPMSLAEIARGAELSAATAHAMLNGMADEGYLIKDPVSKRFVLGPTLMRLGAAAGSRNDEVLTLAQSEINLLSEQLDRHVLVSQVIEDHIFIVKQAGKIGPWGMRVQVGQRVTFAPPIGLVFLAWAEKVDVDAWLRRYDATVSQDVVVKCTEAFEGVRKHGYALARNVAVRENPAAVSEKGELRHPSLETMLNSGYFLTELDDEETYSMVSIAAPVFGPDGQVRVALALSYVGEVMSGRQAREDAIAVLEAARRVTSGIQGRPPADIP